MGGTAMQIMRIDTDVDGVKETKLFAVDGETVLGTIGVVHEGRKSAAVRQLFVIMTRRRQGIGGMLLEAACQLAAKSKCETVGLSLAADNEYAWKFYRAHGFIRAYEYDDGSWAVCRKVSF